MFIDNQFKTYSLKTPSGLFIIDSPKIMGILNTGANSFYDGGKYNEIDKALFQTEKMLNEGADLIDIGAQSTKPFSDEIDSNEEIQLTSKLIYEIKKRFDKVIISIDTYKHAVAESAFNHGADIINDISFGIFDEKILSVAQKNQIPFIGMHCPEKPKTMQVNPEYKDVVSQVYQFLGQRVNSLIQLGINDVVIDPGFGFGKTLKNNYELLNNLNVFNELNCPILVGLSRKSMLSKVIENTPDESLNATSVANTIALLQHVHILRVHDVKEAKECIKITNQLLIDKN